MSGFIKVIDYHNNKVYINACYIISVRPDDHRSFKDSGTVIKVQEGAGTVDYSINAGNETQDALHSLGIKEG
ncbi:hypothetical protein INQ40_00645 [Lysobacter sp. H21R4]|uniref:hypothetical protein n=1 Tax=Lysobacter sp. H21R4 TaxID=2781021 RepID=UPI001886C0F4|nr:hypothetical protein [Lysobacter sp. H21R4]QOY62864.1 hypothetical protein INQ40_00645 [Lysobacter sp. H21R4]